VVLQPDEVQALMEEAKGGNHVVSVDLESQTVVSPSGRTFNFQIDPQRKEKMLKASTPSARPCNRLPTSMSMKCARALAKPWLEDA